MNIEDEIMDPTNFPLIYDEIYDLTSKNIEIKQLAPKNTGGHLLVLVHGF